MAGERIAPAAVRRDAICVASVDGGRYNNRTNREHELQIRQHYRNPQPIMRDDYLQAARKVIDDPNILINVVSTRVKQLRRGHRPLVASLEKLAFEDIALREIAEGRITYRLPTAEELARP